MRVHLERLAQATDRLAACGLHWSPVDRQVCTALRYISSATDAPVLIGIVGGASSGKSTLFNTLLDRRISTVSAHAHETVGGIAASPAQCLAEFDATDESGGLFPDLECVQMPDSETSVGSIGRLHVYQVEADGFDRCILVDLPDMTSQMSADEGAAAELLAPWFDGLIVVLDEERWFDARVVESVARCPQQFGTTMWVVFNCTGPNQAPTPEQRQTLAESASRGNAADWCYSPYRPGSGYRPMDASVRRTVTGWIATQSPGKRSARLRSHVADRCANVLRINVDRAAEFDALRRDVDRALDEEGEQANLSVDLLTPAERKMLGVGRQLVPLYDLLHAAGRLFKGRGAAGVKGLFRSDESIRADELKQLLEQNFAIRFQHAADRAGRLVQDSDYLSSASSAWQPIWEAPPFDASDWADRIGAHLDAWKAEANQRAKRGDSIGLAVGLPLLAADLLVLGGAGFTWAWATASLAGLLGGKSVGTLLSGSKAYQGYQTTVRAYQALLREHLRQQWQTNLDRMPRRHLPMTDPVVESLMALSSPGGR